MIVELNKSFYKLPFFNQLPKHSMIHKTYNEIKGNPEAYFLKEMINQVLLNEPVWGRNKRTYDISKIKTNQQIFNFDFFYVNQFQHYHLLDFNTLTNYNYSNWTDITIHNPNQNTSGFLVHYQLLNNKIIIHSVSNHGLNNPWNALFDLIEPNSYGYDTCLICHKNYPSSLASCPKGCVSLNKGLFVGVEDKILLQDFVSTDKIYINKIIEDFMNTQYIFLNNKYSNFGDNIIIENIHDLQKYL